MLSKKYAVFAAVLLSVSGFGAAAADNEESLWGYADPTADVMLYLNTKQPEKGMDKSIWERIRKDKEKALKENGNEEFSSMKDQDVELIANFRISSVTPFCGTIEGVANISGDMLGDIDKIMKMMKEQKSEEGGEGLPVPEVSKKDNMDFYNMNVEGENEGQGLDVMFVPVTPNRIQFRVNINPTDKMSQALVAPFTGSGNVQPSEGFKSLIGQDVALGCFLVPDKIANLNLEGSDSMEELSGFLKKVSELSVTVQVSGTLTIIKSVISFKSESDAATFAKTTEEVLSELKSYLGSDQSPRSTVTGKILNITIPINISDAWDMISRYTDLTDIKEIFGIDEDDENPMPKNVVPNGQIKIPDDTDE